MAVATTGASLLPSSSPPRLCVPPPVDALAIRTSLPPRRLPSACNSWGDRKTIFPTSCSSPSIPTDYPTKPLPESPDLLPSSDGDAILHRALDCLRLCDEIRLGKSIHAFIARRRDADKDTRLGNALIAMYARLASPTSARTIFDRLSSPDVASYTTLVSCYGKSGRGPEAMSLFHQMRLAGAVEPNEFTFVAVLTVCIRNEDVFLGSQIHALAIKTDHALCVFVSNALMGVYVKCGRVEDAVRVFDNMPVRDVASWNTVISGLVRGAQFETAIGVFRDMQLCGFRTDHFSLSIVLTAATAINGFWEGKEIHAHALRIGFGFNLSVNNALIAFYTRCGDSIGNAIHVFERMSVRDVISWTEMLHGFMEFGMVESAEDLMEQMPERNCITYNAFLAGLCQNGEGERAIKLFQRMVEGGMEISDFTLTSAVNSCSLLSEANLCQQVHGFVFKVGFGSNAWIEAALLDMYTKCGRMSDAQLLFLQLASDERHLIEWTTMIHGYARIGQPDEALALFCDMLEQDNVIMDEAALATVLGVCGDIGLENKGKQIHCCIVKSGFVSDLALENAIISMYFKCGNIEDAVRVFNLMPEHDLVSWNALISGYLLHRQGDMALQVWENMEKEGIVPDEISLVLILSSCRHTKLNSVETCRRLFLSMSSCYAIPQSSEHYAAMVSVLGFWNCIEEAEDLIENMPFTPNAIVWRALLDCCRLHSSISAGKRAAKQILALELKDPSMYVLAANLYSASGRWHCAERLREEMKGKGLHKNPVRSWVIHDNVVHSFYTRDRSHLQMKDIYRGLEILILECMKVGYVPDTSFVLQEVEEHQKKDFLFHHSAKLAATYGILMAAPGKPVRVVKNVHLCGDCHSFLKCASVSSMREIILRDSTGFHCFRSGECSCGDYW